MTGSTQFNATIDKLSRLGFVVNRITPGDAEIGEGPTAYMTRVKGSQRLQAQVDEVSPHDILVNGETLSEFEDWFAAVKR